MTYTLTAQPNTIVRDEDSDLAFIPADPDNIDYQAYLTVVRGRHTGEGLHAAACSLRSRRNVDDADCCSVHVWYPRCNFLAYTQDCC